MPNSREIAVMLIVFAITCITLLSGNVRKSFAALARSLVSSVGLVIAGYLGWITVAIITAARLGAWDPSMATSTVFWLATVGAPICFSADKLVAKPKLLATRLLGALGFAAIIELLIEYQTFGVAVEVAVQIFVALLVVIAAISSRAPELKSLATCANALIILAVGTMLLASLRAIATSPEQFFALGTLRAFAMPIWLTLAALMFAIPQGLVMSWTSLIRQARLAAPSERRHKWVLVSGLAFRPLLVARFNRLWLNRFFRAGSRDEAEAELRRFLLAASRRRSAGVVQARNNLRRSLRSGRAIRTRNPDLPVPGEWTRVTKAQLAGWQVEAFTIALTHLNDTSRMLYELQNITRPSGMKVDWNETGEWFGRQLASIDKASTQISDALCSTTARALDPANSPDPEGLLEFTSRIVLGIHAWRIAKLDIFSAQLPSRAWEPRDHLGEAVRALINESESFVDRAATSIALVLEDDHPDEPSTDPAELILTINFDVANASLKRLSASLKALQESTA